MGNRPIFYLKKIGGYSHQTIFDNDFELGAVGGRRGPSGAVGGRR